MLGQSGRLEEAERHLIQSCELREKLLERDPANTTTGKNLAKSYRDLGNICIALGAMQDAPEDVAKSRLAKAEEWYAKAATLLDEMIQAGTLSPQDQPLYHLSGAMVLKCRAIQVQPRLANALRLARQEKHGDATRIVEESFNSSDNPFVCYLSGCVNSLSAGALPPEETVSGARHAYVTRAADYLSRSFSYGLLEEFDVSLVMNDPDLDPIRGSAEFQTLLEEQNSKSTNQPR